MSVSSSYQLHTQTMTNLLKQKRRARGMTQSALARKLGITSSAVSEWERGKNGPAAKLIPKLSRLLNIPADELGAAETATASA
jgi:transcriptional regulator with XRE-family HTH domain